MSEPMEDKRLERSVVKDHFFMVMQLQTRNNALECEVAALQSQITALKEKNDRNECLVEQLQEYSDDWDTLKEVVNGASIHPETGVSLVDDVRDLVKERDELKAHLGNTDYRAYESRREEVAGYKAQVEQQAYYIKCLVEEVRSLKHDKEV